MSGCAAPFHSGANNNSYTQCMSDSLALAAATAGLAGTEP
jgi:hypothetical protein